jgi:hypothetical protein
MIEGCKPDPYARRLTLHYPRRLGGIGFETIQIFMALPCKSFSYQRAIFSWRLFVVMFLYPPQ